MENLAEHRSERRLRLVEGDVRDAGAIADALRGADIVYHLAAQSPEVGVEEDVDAVFATNVLGTFNVLRAAARHGVGSLVFASSHAAYGEPVALPVSEGQPLLAISTYGASKAAGEVYCRAFRQEFGLQTNVLRLARVYGARDVGRMIPVWLQRAAAGQDLPVYNGKQVADFIWVGQAVEALVRAAAPNRPLPPINVASGTGTRLVDVARRIARLVGGQGQITLLPGRAAEVTRFVADVERMQQLLRIDPPLDPFEHLPDLVGRPVALAG